MDRLMIGLNAKRSFARPTPTAEPAVAVANAVSVKVGVPLPEVRPIAAPSIGVSMFALEANAMIASNNTANQFRFATFEELGEKPPTMTAAVSANATANAVANAAANTAAAQYRFVSFKDLGLLEPRATNAVAVDSTPLECKNGVSVTQSSGRSVTYHWKAKDEKKMLKKKEKEEEEEKKKMLKKSVSPKRVQFDDVTSSDEEPSSPRRITTAGTLLDMDEGSVVDARSLSLAPPAAVVGEAYALSIKGIKRAIKGVRGKVKAGGPVVNAFSTSNPDGRAGLSDAQFDLVSKMESSKIDSARKLVALDNKSVYEPVMRGTAQQLQFRFGAKKKLVPVSVRRAPFRYTVAKGQVLAGHKIVHFGGLENVGSKKSLLVLSKRKGGGAAAKAKVYKGQPITVTYVNAATNTKSVLTVDNAVEFDEKDAAAYPGNARVWYAVLDGASAGPMLVVMRFSGGSLSDRLSDLVFVYPPEVELKADGTKVLFFGSEHRLGDQMASLVDQTIAAGLDAATKSNGAHDFKQSLGALQALVGATFPSSNLSQAQTESLAVYLGALAACVHAHSYESETPLDTDTLDMLADTDGVAARVTTDQTREISQEFSSTLHELATDLVAHDLDAHAITIRAGHLYERVFASLHCGEDILAQAAADATTSSDISSKADAHLSSLAVTAFAHIVGYTFAATPEADNLQHMWSTVCAHTTDNDIDYEMLVASVFSTDL